MSDDEYKISRQELLDSANLVAEVFAEATPLVNQLIASIEAGNIDEVREDIAAIRDQMKKLRTEQMQAWFKAMHVRSYRPLFFK